MSGSVKERKGIAFYNTVLRPMTFEGLEFHWAGQMREQTISLLNE